LRCLATAWSYSSTFVGYFLDLVDQLSAWTAGWPFWWFHRTRQNHSTRPEAEQYRAMVSHWSQGCARWWVEYDDAWECWLQLRRLYVLVSQQVLFLRLPFSLPWLSTLAFHLLSLGAELVVHSWWYVLVVAWIQLASEPWVTSASSLSIWISTCPYVPETRRDWLLNIICLIILTSWSGSFAVLEHKPGRSLPAAYHSCLSSPKPLATIPVDQYASHARDCAWASLQDRRCCCSIG